MVSIISTLNAAYDITEGRPFWKVRLTAIGLTSGSPSSSSSRSRWCWLARLSPNIWRTRMHLGRRSSGRGGSCSGRSSSRSSRSASVSSITSRRTPSRTGSGSRQDQSSRPLLWVVVSLGLKLYLAYFRQLQRDLRHARRFIVLLTWFYLSGLAILIGAELNAEIEHASPYGKNVGEKVPGEKKKIGPAAESGVRGKEGQGNRRRTAISR